MNFITNFVCPPLWGLVPKRGAFVASLFLFGVAMGVFRILPRKRRFRDRWCARVHRPSPLEGAPGAYGSLAAPRSGHVILDPSEESPGGRPGAPPSDRWIGPEGGEAEGRCSCSAFTGTSTSTSTCSAPCGGCSVEVGSIPCCRPWGNTRYVLSWRTELGGKGWTDEHHRCAAGTRRGHNCKGGRVEEAKRTGLTDARESRATCREGRCGSTTRR